MTKDVRLLLRVAYLHTAAIVYDCDGEERLQHHNVSQFSCTA